MIVLLVALASIQLALTSGAGLSTVYSLKDLGNHWSVFKQTHSKKYTNSSHEMERKAKFQKNLIRINEHNARYSNGSETYFLGPTIFADWDAQEFASFVKSGGLNTNLISKNVTKVTLTKRVSAPASIDWRSNNGKNYVQAIKNQASCGSCWAFSSVSALESYAALSSNGNLPNLSEQNLVDCVYNYDTCNNGGQNTDAWSYVQRNGGIATGSNYPYKSGSTQTVS